MKLVQALLDNLLLDARQRHRSSPPAKATRRGELALSPMMRPPHLTLWADGERARGKGAARRG